MMGSREWTKTGIETDTVSVLRLPAHFPLFYLVVRALASSNPCQLFQVQSLKGFVPTVNRAFIRLWGTPTGWHGNAGSSGLQRDKSQGKVSIRGQN